MILAVLCGSASAEEQLTAADLVEVDVVSAELYGKRWVGVRYVIDEGWHIYWENPGDTGMTTTASLQPPDGWRARGPLYPGPHRFDLPGELVNYGYEGQVTLLFVLEPAGAWDAPMGPVTAKTDWLVCKQACLPGSNVVDGDLTEQRGADAIRGAIERLPQTWRVGAPGAVHIEAPNVTEAQVFPTVAAEEAGAVTASLADGVVTLSPEPTDLLLQHPVVIRLASPAGDRYLITESAEHKPKKIEENP